MNTVLVADASPRQLARCVDALAALPIRVEAVNSLAHAVARACDPSVRVVVVGANVSTAGPEAAVRALQEACRPGPAIVLVLPRAEARATDVAVSAGAADVLVSPFDASLLANKVELAIKLCPDPHAAPPGDAPWPDTPVRNGAERRRFVRQSVCEPMRLRPSDGGPFEPGRVLDVSEAATKFQAQRALPVAAWCEFECPFLADLLDLGDRRLHTRIIRRAAEHPDNVYAASLAGIGEAESQRVRRWIFAEQARRVRVPGPDRGPVAR